MVFNQPADFLDINFFHIIHKDYGMGVSHGHGSDMIFFTLDSQTLFNGLFILAFKRDIPAKEDRFTHVHPDFSDKQIVIKKYLRDDGSSLCVHSYLFFKNYLSFIQNFCKTPHSIAAHLGLRAIGIIYPEFNIMVRVSGFNNKDNAVCAYAKMS